MELPTSFSGQYCIELIPDPSNPGDAISIVKNGHVFDITPAQKDFVETHRTCFDSFDVENDVIELQNGGIHSVTISVNLINGKVTKQLLFGKDADMTWLKIDGDHSGCREDSEKAGVIKIQNGIITKSACVGMFIKIILLYRWSVTDQGSTNRRSSISHLFSVLVLVDQSMWTSRFWSVDP